MTPSLRARRRQAEVLAEALTPRPRRRLAEAMAPAAGCPPRGLQNCLGFPDPNPITWHYGTHPDIMGRLLQNEARVAFFFEIVHGRFLNGTREFYFYCRSGNHRSVALAELCAHVYNTTARGAATVDHMMQWKGPTKKCRICNACDSERAGYQRTVAVHYEKMMTIARPILDRDRRS